MVIVLSKNSQRPSKGLPTYKLETQTCVISITSPKPYRWFKNFGHSLEKLEEIEEVGICCLVEAVELLCPFVHLCWEGMHSEIMDS